MQGGIRYYSINRFLREYFGCKTVKLSIDAGFSCPNRDGTLAYGGCAFCSAGGSGELASDIPGQIDLLKTKWPNAKYLAYFQSHTNTYADVDTLERLYRSALDDDNISGIVISTRPDCLPPDVLDLLSDINRKYFMWVELGLQSIHPETQEMLGLCYDTSAYDQAVSDLNELGIRVVSHLILGLPGESREMMLETLSHAVSGGIFGIKLHLLNIIRGSRLYEMMPDYIPFDSMDEYVDLVVDMLEHIPSDVTIHRLTGDVPRRLLVAPEWSYRKRTILNAINRELETRNTWQGAGLK